MKGLMCNILNFIQMILTNDLCQSIICVHTHQPFSNQNFDSIAVIQNHKSPDICRKTDARVFLFNSLIISVLIINL